MLRLATIAVLGVVGLSACGFNPQGFENFAATLPAGNDAGQNSNNNNNISGSLDSGSSVKDSAIKDGQILDANQPPVKTPVEFSENQLRDKLESSTAACVDNNGSPAGNPVSLLDTNGVNFFGKERVLENAPNDAVQWIGSRSAVAIVYDLKSCGLEDPVNGDYDWKSAGLIIRGAHLIGNNRILLDADVTIADMDFADLDVDGRFEGADFAKVDDSELSSNYKQLAPSIQRVKEILLEIGFQ